MSKIEQPIRDIYGQLKIFAYGGYSMNNTLLIYEYKYLCLSTGLSVSKSEQSELFLGPED